MTLGKAWMENNTIRMLPHEFVVQDVIEEILTTTYMFTLY